VHAPIKGKNDDSNNADQKAKFQELESVEKGVLFADSHGILARWRNHLSQLLNVHGVNDVRQAEIHTAEPLLPEPSAFEFELPIEKLQSHNSKRSYQIPAELIKVGGRTIWYEIHKLTSAWNKEDLSEEWKESIIVPIYKKGDKQIVVIRLAYHFRQQRTKFYPTSFYQG